MAYKGFKARFPVSKLRKKEHFKEKPKLAFVRKQNKRAVHT